MHGHLFEQRVARSRDVDHIRCLLEGAETDLGDDEKKRSGRSKGYEHIETLNGEGRESGQKVARNLDATILGTTLFGEWSWAVEPGDSDCRQPRSLCPPYYESGRR